MRRPLGSTPPSVEVVGVDRGKREESLKFVRAGVEPEEEAIFLDEGDPLAFQTKGTSTARRA